MTTNYTDFKKATGTMMFASAGNVSQPVFNGLTQALTANPALFNSAVWSLLMTRPQTAPDSVIRQITVQALRWRVQVGVNTTFPIDQYHLVSIIIRS